ncbi:MAG: sulfite oxidase-like oxidoreductase [Anaerolineales bacterium]
MFKGIRERKALEDRVKREGRLPPGQSLTTKFPVLHYGPTPQLNLEKWDLRIFGAVENEVRWDWEQFNQLPQTRVVMDIHCVTRWSKFDTEWKGVHLRTLVEQGILKLKPEARFVVQHCEHGFTTNIPVELALADNFLLATHLDGAPIAREHGYPLRCVVGAIPGRSDLHEPYFWKGGKWLRALEFRAEDHLGFWEQAGYHNDADVWKEQRFSYG